MHGFPVRRFSLAVAGFCLLLLALVPAVVGASSPYPPNTTVSTYFDARFCGNGQVSVVSDQNSNLVDVCTATGQRIDPSAYAVPGYNYGYTGYAPGYSAGIVPSYPVGGVIPSYPVGGIAPAYGSIANGQVIRQYNDGNSNCPNGDVTETTSGFFCTANGQPAASSLSAPIFNGGFTPYAPGFNGTAYGAAVNGQVIRQYNDGRSNCPNGDVTETTSGFFCTASGQPAFRAS